LQYFDMNSNHKLLLINGLNCKSHQSNILRLIGSKGFQMSRK
jgi:hypothetical protein